MTMNLTDAGTLVRQALRGEAKAEPASLQAAFDALPNVEIEHMFGDWKGGLFDTGHPGEAQIAKLGWDGKTFRSRNDVDPMVTLDDQGQRVANPVMGSAVIRHVEYRGSVTATMVYDQHPIMDYFKRMDANTVLGVMDRKGDDTPLYFYLTRLTTNA